jgi:hypothetical protein
MVACLNHLPVPQVVIRYCTGQGQVGLSAPPDWGGVDASGGNSDIGREREVLRRERPRD